MPVDFTKPVRRKNGQPARIIATDLKSEEYPVVVAVSKPTGGEFVALYTAEGQHDHTGLSEHDLENVPEQFSRFVNVYPGYHGSCINETKSEADGQAGSNRIGVVEMVYEKTGGKTRLVTVTVV